MWEGKKKVAFGLIVGVLMGFVIAGHGQTPTGRPERHPPIAARAKDIRATRHVVRKPRHRVYHGSGPRPLCTSRSTLTEIVSHACVPG
jgi:hypothetical protein